jgi:hydroxypyruvate isomerase
VRIAANIDWLFTGAPMLDRLALARAAGFDGVEVLFPYDHAPAAWEAALAGCPVALINTPAGDWAAGERGFAAVPGADAQFRDGFARALEHGAAMGAERLHVLAGVAAGPAAGAAFRRNLTWAAGFGHPLTIEPLNPVDMPGYFLNGFAEAAAVLDDLAILHLGLQFDTWHAARLGGVAPLWATHGARAVHVQIAGEPDRTEPDAGTLAFAAGIGRGGYGGWIAGEYRPAAAGPPGWPAALRSA